MFTAFTYDTLWVFYCLISQNILNFIEFFFAATIFYFANLQEFIVFMFFIIFYLCIRETDTSTWFLNSSTFLINLFTFRHIRVLTYASVYTCFGYIHNEYIYEFQTVNNSLKNNICKGIEKLGQNHWERTNIFSKINKIIL